MQRINDIYRPTEERKGDWREVERLLTDEELKDQTSRCMNCGQPFCHAYGCPLGNLVPDQNRAVAQGDWKKAYELLSAHSDFPEFTSRICPALCEASCVHGLDEEAVMIRQSEKRIIETAFAEGWVVPRAPKMENGKSVAVIGAGPAGLSAAVTLRRKGWAVTVYERRKEIGGLLRYGIPCFKLDKSIIDRRRKVLEAEGIRFVTGIEVGRDLSAEWLQRSFDALVVAIGTPAARDLKIPGRELGGIHLALELLEGENKFLTGETPEPPIDAKGKDVLVIGGGDTGSDCVGTSIRQGAKSVTQIEIMPKPPDERDASTPWPLWPYMLRTSSSHKEGCTRRWNLNSLRFVEGSASPRETKTVAGVEVETVEWEFSPEGRPLKFRAVPGTKETIKADLIFLAMGFTGVPSDNPIVSQLGIAQTPRTALISSPERNIHFVGDCASGASLVVRALASGKQVPLDLKTTAMNQQSEREQQGLYKSEYEHDACGVGMVANLSGEPSHEIVENGMTILKRLMHRGATGNDSETGDGAGLLLKIPHEFFSSILAASGAKAPKKGEIFGIAMIFGGEGEEKKIEDAVKGEGCDVIGWRDVPTNPDAIGHDARAVMPKIRQLFIEASAPEIERRLYIVRRMIEKATTHTYICSCSSRTIVYKGLLLATQIERFYPDLTDPGFISPFAIVHQRYSTNTFPTWELAHPFRAIAHNGEINAIKGNLTALAAREKSLASPAFGDEIGKVLPIVHGGQSDSASLDNIFELLVAAGRDAPHAMMMLIPQAWGAKYHMGHDVRAFYEYHSALMEPWDGPAAVAFTDGKGLGAALDRNGLRPARWTLTKRGLFVLASETGVLDIPAGEVLRHGRLRPGSMLWLDLETHRFMEDAELKTFYARRRPYRRWIYENHIPVTGLFSEIVPSRLGDGESGKAALARDQRTFGYTLEDIELILRPMAESGKEPVGAMGNDAALACLRKAENGRFRLFDCFHQLFAQVTNPPIDPIREELVMSIMTYIGNQGNILAETPEHARLVKMTRPVLTDDEIRRIRNIPGFPAKTLPLHFEGSLKTALDALAANALKAVKEGVKIIILSDKGIESCCETRQCIIPSLLAVAAVNKALTEAGVRPSVGVVVESGEVFEVHHFAVLLGFGATAVNPYLALATVSEIGKADAVMAAANYVTAVCKGIMKIMSKMGISTLRSYRSAHIFEAVGLGPKLMHDYFTGVTSPVGGLELEGLEKIISRRGAKTQSVGGEYRTRKGGDEHLWTPQRLIDFREAVRNDDFARFKRYTDDIDSNSHVTLRSQLEFREQGTGNGKRGCDGVEPVDSIVKSFVGGAMSLGSLSPEAHETIAIALNGLGTMSNSGEGGEDPERFGTERNSAIKQVASGRFGVTVEYIRSAKDLQIKLAQGAKPGEGGQLPAHKVDALVARLRHAKPGTTLISPPPHHDIYSIEDLAQLIYDLKCANPDARVSVKLVSEAGVGTIAAGVAKAHADVVVISGFDGGTGAAPLTSMKHAGLPWEAGLAEAHQTLVKNNLRSHVKLQVDGQIRTGRDIVVAAMLGADEFAFGTSMLVSLGCVQCRNCNLNCCPVGIATQKAELRKKFAGKPEHLQRYFRFLAKEVREHLASLGLKSLAEARGRADLLKAKAGTRFDFGDMLLAQSRGDAETSSAGSGAKPNYDLRELIPHLKADGETNLVRKISNCDRSVGAALSGHLAKLRASEPPREAFHVSVDFTGVAGQSFGAFLTKGVTFNLQGEANDYVGKSLSGGVITIRPPVEKETNSAFRPEDSVIAGNVIAYGATSGAIFINGQAGERFGIRNSGATLVVEGIGDHGCEYMTGGVAVILGPVGVNFAAGMTGGVAYAYDEAATLDLNCNLDSVDLLPVEAGSEDEAALMALLREHEKRTGSPKAKAILSAWQEARPRFAKVEPTKGI